MAKKKSNNIKQKKPSPYKNGLKPKETFQQKQKRLKNDLLRKKKKIIKENVQQKRARKVKNRIAKSTSKAKRNIPKIANEHIDLYQAAFKYNPSVNYSSNSIIVIGKISLQFESISLQ